MRTTTSVSTNAAMPTAVHTACTRARSAVEPGDGDEADAVEQERERQQRRFGAGREPAHREVRDDEQAEHRAQEHPEVGGDVRLVGEEQQHVAGRGHDDGEEPEAELPVRRRGR